MSLKISRTTVHACARHLVLGLLFIIAITAWSYPADQDMRHITCQFTFAVRSAPNARHVRLVALIPQTVPGRETVKSIVYSDPEHTHEYSAGGNRYALFEFTPTSGMQMITVTCEIDLYRRDLATLTASGVAPLPEDEETLKGALGEEKYLETQAPLIVDTAGRITGKDEIDELRNIMRFVTRNMSYSGYDPSADNGALWALKARHGECTEFSRLFVALCRAKGIPARVNEGYSLVRVMPGDTIRHEWVEAYTKDYGWVPFDALHIKSGAATFEHMENNYLRLTTRLNDPELNGGYFMYCRATGEQPTEPAWARVKGDFSFHFHD